MWRIYSNPKMGWGHLPKVKGIENCTNQGPGPFQRGDNHKNAKMGWGHLKITNH
jgi:hypothetical protein